MMHRIAWMVLLGLLAIDAWAGSFVAGPADQARIWRADVRDQARRLLELGDESPAAVLDGLDRLYADADVHPADRDAAVMAYLKLLRVGPPERIPAAVLERLSAYQPLAVRVHDESATATVPLFDIAASAQGLRNELRFRKSAERLLTTEPARYAAVLKVLAGDDPAERNGLHWAVSVLPDERLSALADALGQVQGDGDESLALLVMLARDDVEALSSAVTRAPAAAATQLLLRLDGGAGHALSLTVAESALAHPDPGVRAQAVAVGSRVAQGHPGSSQRWRERLRALLIDPDIGAAAALHLSRVMTAEELNVLKRMTTIDPDSLLSRRLALIERLRASNIGEQP